MIIRDKIPERFLEHSLFAFKLLGSNIVSHLNLSIDRTRCGFSFESIICKSNK